MLSSYGINLVPQIAVSGLADAIAAGEQLGWNVVLKATTAAVRGRPDLASVHRNIDNPAELTEAWKDLRQLMAETGLPDDEDLSAAKPVVQAMAPPGVALVIASREDAAFGPIVSLGLDGIPSELLGDIVYRVPPLTTVEARPDGPRAQGRSYSLRSARRARSRRDRGRGPAASGGAAVRRHSAAGFADAAALCGLGQLDLGAGRTGFRRAYR